MKWSGLGSSDYPRNRRLMGPSRPNKPCSRMWDRRQMYAAVCIWSIRTLRSEVWGGRGTRRPLGNVILSFCAAAIHALLVTDEAFAADTIEHCQTDSSVLANPSNPREASVYLPDGYGSSSLRYPVIYLMHRAGGRNKTTFADFLETATSGLADGSDARSTVTVASDLLCREGVGFARTSQETHVCVGAAREIPASAQGNLAVPTAATLWAAGVPSRAVGTMCG